MWDGNYYALEVTTRLGEESSGMVRVGPVRYNQAPLFWVRSPALWGTLEEIKRFGEGSGRLPIIQDNAGLGS